MFKNKNKNILQYASLIQGISDLKPSKNYIPQWYKEIKPQSKNNLEFNEDGTYQRFIGGEKHTKTLLGKPL